MRAADLDLLVVALAEADSAWREAIDLAPEGAPYEAWPSDVQRAVQETGAIRDQAIDALARVGAALHRNATLARAA